jgi:uncharacterized membrane protein
LEWLWRWPRARPPPINPLKRQRPSSRRRRRWRRSRKARKPTSPRCGVGQEPGWLIDIHRQDRIVLLLDYGESLTEFPLPAPSAPQEGVTRYETQAHGKSLTVTIRRTPCQDGMSGETYPARVEIVIDGRALNGCGRSV